jgi:hypothetical protein
VKLQLKSTLILTLQAFSGGTKLAQNYFSTERRYFETNSWEYASA